MAEGIVYLDVDDEITSAASRIRNAPGTKVALVVPYGSRIATSRMNFRLLSREAVMSNKRLSIVSGDAAARSLAASAGLPVFGTVPEYESAIAKPGVTAETAADDGGAGSATEVAAAGPAGAAATAAALPATQSVTIVDPASASPAAAARKSQRPKRPVPGERATIAPVAAPEQIADTMPNARPHADDPLAPVAGERSGGRNRAPLFAAVGLVGLAVVILAVGGYLFLPSATIVVTARRDPVGPIELTVSADPDTTEVDAANNVVPAVRLQVPVEVGQTFTTTGKHIEETAARGSVTFTNYDTSSGVSISSGSIVSTEGGVGFRTQQTVVLQPAGILPFSPTSDSVAVSATRPGEGGNVPANTIRVVPQGQNPDLLKVNNPAPTSGGNHTETPEVTKAEVDKAIAALQTELGQAFTTAVAAGAGAPADAKLFPETATLGPTTPDVDPKTLVGTPVGTFDLKLSAIGTVIAVDPRPVTGIARAQLDAQIAKDHRLIADSVAIQVGDGTVGEDGQVTFQAFARAMQVAIVDPNAIRSLVKGKTAADAAAALVPFGTASVQLWPDWVSTVPTFDPRLSITIDDAGLGGGPSTSPSPAGSGRSPSPRPAPSTPASGPPAASPSAS